MVPHGVGAAGTADWSTIAACHRPGGLRSLSLRLDSASIALLRQSYHGEIDRHGGRTRAFHPT